MAQARSYNQSYPKSLLLLGIISLFLISGTLSGCNKQDGNAQAQQKPPAQVAFITAQYQAIPRVTELSGRVVAYKESQVRPQVSGIIEKQMFVEGSYVAAGQPLYRVDASTLEATTNTQKATLIRAKAALEASQNKLNRYQKLIGTNAISQQDFDDTKSEVALAKADVAAAEAALKNSQINLDRTVIRAPISGKTGRSNVTEGALVSTGQTTELVTISQLDPVYIDISQSTAQMLSLQKAMASTNSSTNAGGKVTLILEDGSTYAETGRLAFSEARVDQETGSVKMRAIFDNPDRILLPGMYATAKVQQGMLSNAILLPQSAIMRTPKGKSQVYIVTGDNNIKVQPVTINGTHDGKWVVTDGIESGQKVVVSGGMKAKPGEPVKPVPHQPDPQDNGTKPAIKNNQANTSQSKDG